MPMNHRSTECMDTSQPDDQRVATLRQKPPHTAICRVHEVVDVVYEFSDESPLNCLLDNIAARRSACCKVKAKTTPHSSLQSV
jgi:tRNA(His) 5'-end guanylyltransferase